MSEQTERLHVTIVDNPEHHRVEARADDGSLTGFAQYYVRDGAYVFFHTEVDDDYEGQGIGSQIAGASSSSSVGAECRSPRSARSSGPTCASTPRPRRSWLPDSTSPPSNARAPARPLGHPGECYRISTTLFISKCIGSV
ncbi:MAG: N-acetyltransferase [Nocardioidaceae bacterium]|nr:MAG: N-acetyltransferase [Nocardioidaceae bacterium]